MRKRIKIKHSSKNTKGANYRFNAENKRPIHVEIVDQQKPQYIPKIGPNKQSFKKQNFLLAFVNAFNFGFVNQRRTKENDIQDFLNIIINDFNCSFKKLKNNYERERN